MTTAAEIAKGLSTEECAALEYVQTNGSYPINDEDKSLTNFDRVFLKGLLNKIYNQGIPRYFLNVYGNAILEARASAPVAGKPAAVTAKEFVEQRYAEKIAKGECVVKDEYLFCLIEPLSDCKPEVSGNYIFKTQARMNDTGWWESEINPSEKLSIVWLTPPHPASPQPVSAKPRHEWQDLAPAGMVWLAEMLTDKVQQTAVFESRQDAQEWLDSNLKQYHPEHFGDTWFEDEEGSTVGWHGTNDLNLSLEYIQKATEQPVSATAEDSEADLTNKLLSVKELPLHWIESHRARINDHNRRIIENDVLDLADLAEALQARLSIQQAELTALRDQNAKLRELAGKAAAVLDHFDLTGDLLNDLRQAAQEGEG